MRQRDNENCLSYLSQVERPEALRKESIQTRNRRVKKKAATEASVATMAATSAATAAAVTPNVFWATEQTMLAALNQSTEKLN